MTPLNQFRGEGIYLNLFTDFAFKTTFGNEENKPYLIQFLNTLLEGEEEILVLVFLPTEKMGTKPKARKAIYDLFCETARGEKIIVELQQEKHENFKERLIYYSTWPIQSQGQRGDEWNFKINTVYTIGILAFEQHPDEHLIHKAHLIDDKTGNKWSSALCYITLETKKVPKRLQDCDSDEEYWSWLFLNAHSLKDSELPLPKLFKNFLEKCKLNNIPKFDEDAYRKSLMDLQELNAVKAYALKEGRKEAGEEGRKIGFAEGQKEILDKLRASGMSEEEIQKILES